MNQKVISLAVLLGCIALGSASPTSHMTLCSRSSSSNEFSRCVKKSIEELVPYLKTGIIEPGFTIKRKIWPNFKVDVYKNKDFTTAMDPFNIGNLQLNQGFNMSMYDWKVYDFTSFEVKTVKAKLNPFKVNFKFISNPWTNSRPLLRF